MMISSIQSNTGLQGWCLMRRGSAYVGPQQRRKANRPGRIYHKKLCNECRRKEWSPESSCKLMGQCARKGCQTNVIGRLYWSIHSINTRYKSTKIPPLKKDPTLLSDDRAKPKGKDANEFTLECRLELYDVEHFKSDIDIDQLLS
jgi:hypothetical protein